MSMTMRARDFLFSFGRDRRGNTAMLFGLAALPLLAGVGFAVDYTQAESARSRLANAADVAALAGAQLIGKTLPERRAAAEAAFRANIDHDAVLYDVTFSGANIMNSGAVAGFRVETVGYARSAIMNIFGIPHTKLGANSEAAFGDPGKFEFALVLDTTGSMAGAKMVAMQTAATNLIDQLVAKASSADQVKFSLVPFAEYVNVGIANRNQPWISVAPDTSTTTYVCSTTTPVISMSNCHDVPYTYYNDGTPVTTTTTVCDYVYGTPVTTCGNQTSTSSWYGCVGSRNYPLNVRDDSYTTPVPGLMNASCGPALTPLTSDATAIKASINALTANGETYIPTGLAWGWRTLSPQDPFSESQKGRIADPVKQYLLLMTDGANTRSPDYPYHWGTDAALANTLTSELCTAIKADNIVVFTVAFQVTDVTIKNILQSCASGPSQFFDATDAAQLSAAFEAIGQRMSALRIQR